MASWVILETKFLFKLSHWVPLPEPGPPTTGIKIAPSFLFFFGGMPSVSSCYLTSADTFSIEFIALIVMTLPVFP